MVDSVGEISDCGTTGGMKGTGLDGGTDGVGMAAGGVLGIFSRASIALSL